MNMKEKAFKIDEKMLVAAGASEEQIRLFQASEFDHSMAMFSALRDARVEVTKTIEAKEDGFDKETQRAYKAGDLIEKTSMERLYTENQIVSILGLLHTSKHILYFL